MRFEWPKVSRDELRGVLFAVALVAVVSIGVSALVFNGRLSHGSVIYLIPVLLAAARWGLLSALTAALASGIVSAFLFYPPLYTFRVSDPQEAVDLVLFVCVAVVTSHLGARMRREADHARQREMEMRDLYDFSHRLALAHAPSDIYAAIEDHLSAVLHRRVVLSEARAETAGGNGDAGAAAAAVPERVRQAIAGMAEGGGVAGVIVDDAAGGAWLVRPVSPKTAAFGVIAIDLGKHEPDIHHLRERVDAVLADATATLERLGLARAISDARMRTETELLREALIGSVSHELRTPLAAILGAATVLANASAVTQDKRLKALVGVVRDESERLNNDIQNLLHATRIGSEGIRPKREWADPADIVNSAIERQRRRLAGHGIALQVAQDLPLVHVDPVLVEQAMVQILDNAVKYARPGTPIGVAVRSEADNVTLSVTDQGAGLTEAEKPRIWDRFYRGDRHIATTTGSGLGLWIAQAFVAANGGRLQAASAGAGRGTTISIALPAPRDATRHLAGGPDE